MATKSTKESGLETLSGVDGAFLNLDPLHDGTLDQLQQLRVPPMAWAPLAGGRLFDPANERAQRVSEW